MFDANNTKIFVGGVSFKATDRDLSDHFAQAGQVKTAAIITDRATGRSRGFGFVEMETPEDAQRALDTLQGSEMMGRALQLSEARPQEKREFRPRDDRY